MLRKLAALENAERALLVRATICLVEATMTVRLRSFSKLKKHLQYARQCAPLLAGSPSAERVIWAIEAVSRRLPGTSCLIRSIAAQNLLASYGYCAVLQIGVAAHHGTFEAHAWLKQEGTVMLGGSAAPEEYVVLDLSTGHRADSGVKVNP